MKLLCVMLMVVCLSGCGVNKTEALFNELQDMTKELIITFLQELPAKYMLGEEWDEGWNSYKQALEEKLKGEL